MSAQEATRTCPDCGGYGYYRFDYFGNPIGEKVACLMCFGHGVIQEDKN